MTTARSVAVDTPDRRLAAAVASFSGQARWTCVEVEPGVVPDPRPAVVVVDLRGRQPTALSPWVAAGVRILALVDGDDAAAAALASGARDFVRGTASDAEIGLRLARAASETIEPARTAALRRLVRHDVRSPLAVILGQCEILALGLGGPLTDKQRKSVEAVERKAQELRVTLERLADELGEVFGWEAHTRSDGSSGRSSP